MARPKLREIDSAVSVFLTLDTTRQATVLNRVGEATEAADLMLGRLAGMHPDRYGALCTLLGWERETNA